LAQLAGRNGLRAHLDGAREGSDLGESIGSGFKIICFSSLVIGRSSAQVRQYLKRLRRLAGQSKIMLCLWAGDIGELSTRDSGTDLNFDLYASSFNEAISCLTSAGPAFNQHTVAGADAA
jgi:hypothetical protein